MKKPRYKWVQSSPRRMSAKIGPLAIGIVREPSLKKGGFWRVEHIFGNKMEFNGFKFGFVARPEIAQVEAEEHAASLLTKVMAFLVNR